jgi:glycogen synthase kinase 3 beta
LDALTHSFFDELRDEKTRLPSGNKLPDLFDFGKEEITSADPAIYDKLIPKWYREQKEREERL